MIIIFKVIGKKLAQLEFTDRLRLDPCIKNRVQGSKHAMRGKVSPNECMRRVASLVQVLP